MTTRKAYSTDLSDLEWTVLGPGVPTPKPGGRPIDHERREIINAIFYVNRTGCQWRALPHDFPPWSTVYGYYNRWRADGTWQLLMDKLRVLNRIAAGREPEPSAAIIDSQSVKTTEHVPATGKGKPGYDAGKKIKGRKRHILVDTMGLLLLVVVHAASVQDRDGARLVFSQAHLRFSRLRLIWADGGYAGKLIDWVKTNCGWLLEIVKRRDKLPGFKLLPRRWVVERTFGWLGRYRRLTRDYEYWPESSEAMVQIAMIQLMLKRLVRKKKWVEQYLLTSNQVPFALASPEMLTSNDF